MTQSDDHQESDDTHSSDDANVPEDVDSLIEQAFNEVDLIPMNSGILDRITPKHIDKMFELAEMDKKMSHERFTAWTQNQKFMGVLFVIGLLLLCWLFLFFKEASFLNTIIASIIAGFGGFKWGQHSESQSHIE